MNRRVRFIISIFNILFVITLYTQTSSALAGYFWQIPTVAIPTVTSSPMGAVAIVLMDQDQVNVRSGPSTDYPVVGVIIAGQAVPALGRTVGGDWVQIIYPGVEGGVAWVYSPLIRVEGSLPLIEPPPTPTPRTTPTIDPTLAAQFIIELPPTRLPTFTPPGDLVIPTYPDTQSADQTDRVPMGMVIIGMGVVGLFGMLISLLRGR